MDSRLIPGLSLAFVNEGRISHRAAYGLADASSGRAVTHDTVFEAGSLSKPVFAYAALKCCEAGVLNLDTQLADYLKVPYLEDDPRHRTITARHVLSHTTGFPNWRRKKPLKTHFRPGERHSYSSEGYVYLQHVLSHLRPEPTA
jgi:CubicO group peptidase (beta-lactamase class C family)